MGEESAANQIADHSNLCRSCDLILPTATGRGGNPGAGRNSSKKFAAGTNGHFKGSYFFVAAGLPIILMQKITWEYFMERTRLRPIIPGIVIPLTMNYMNKALAETNDSSRIELYSKMDQYDH